MSNLNHDLKKRHLTTILAAELLKKILYCPKYTKNRTGTVSTLHNSHINFKTLLEGNSNLQQRVNKKYLPLFTKSSNKPVDLNCSVNGNSLATAMTAVITTVHVQLTYKALFLSPASLFASFPLSLIQP